MGGLSGRQAPLVGRSAATSTLEEELRRTLGGELRCVVVVGDPGIGKTRLATEFLSRHRRRAATLRARGHPSGAATPFGLWAELLDGHLRSRPADEVSRLCGGLVEDLAGLLRTVAAMRGSWGSGVPPLRIREALTVLLANIARERPAILLLDDMHLADASSWEALDYLARNLADHRLLVVACARLDELVERSVGRHVLFGLEQEGVLSRIPLLPLGAPDVRDLAERVLARPSVPAPLVSWLVTESQGNPFFAVTLLEALLDQGADLAAPRLSMVPPALSDRIASRTERLDAASREMLELLAVVGRPVPLVELRDLCAPAGGDAEGRLRPLVAQGLVTERDEVADLVYEVGHPLIQEGVYSAVDAARRRALHQRVARVLIADRRLGEAASHYARSARRGDGEAIGALLGALSAAWSRETFAEAFVVLGSLVNVLPPGDERWVEVLDALPPNAEWASSYNRVAFDTTSGVSAFRQVEQTLRRSVPLDLPRLALVNSYLAGLLGWCLGEVDEAAERAAATADLFEQAGDAARSRAARCELAWAEGLARRYDVQETATRRVLAAAEATGDHEATLAALGSLAAATQIRGDFDTAWSALRDSIELARATNDPARMRFGQAVLSGTLAFAGELDQARVVLEHAHASGRDTVDTIVLDAAVRLSWEAGELSVVAREAPRVAGLSAPMQQCWLLTCAAMAAAEIGDPTTAAGHLDTIGRHLGGRPFWIISDHVTWAIGRVALAGGDLGAAVAGLDAAAGALCDTGALPLAAYVLADLAEASALADEPAAAARAAARAEHVARRLGRDHFGALAAMAGSAASLSLGRRTAAAQQARTALELLSGRGYRLLEARALTLLGLSLRALDRDDAIDRFRLAAELFDSCGSRWRREAVLAELNDLGKPGQRAAAACLGPDTLTDREHEVAALAAQGLTAKAIGQQLHIGERTVETHLAHVYAKLNVQTRRELVHALGHHARGTGPT